MVDAGAPSDAEKVASYIGSLICLITKSEIRYEGFIFHLDAKECIIGLRNVKSFGTEGRRKGGTEVPPCERLFEYIHFRGNDIKDLQVLSSPSSHTTSALPYDPAIIQPCHPHTPAATISLLYPNAFQATNLNPNMLSGVQVPTLQRTLPPNRAVGVSVSNASMIPAPPAANVIGPPLSNYRPASMVPAPPPANVSGPPSANYRPHSEGTSRPQRPLPLPPPPQGLVLTNPIQKPMEHLSTHASFTGSASNISEVRHPLLPPVGTGSLALIATLPQTLSVQYSNATLTPLCYNLTATTMQSRASGALPTAMVNSCSEVASCSATKSDANPAVPPVTQAGQSLLGPAPFPNIPKAVSRSVDTASTSVGKKSITSHAGMQPDFTKSFSSHYLNDGNDGTNIIAASASDSQSSNSEDTEEAALQLPKKIDIKRHEPASSSHYVNRHQVQDRGVAMHHSSRGRTQGRSGHRIPPNRAYQSYRGYSVERGNVANSTWNPRHNVGVHSHEGGGKISPSATRFNKDFDFEAMNQRFNKEEVWGLLGKSKSAEAEVKEGDDKECNAVDAKDEASVELPKLEQATTYCKDDFFDSISCRSLDAQNGKGKMKMSEMRRLDVETFGEVPKPQQDRGIMGPQRRWSSQGPYHERGFGSTRRGRPATYWNR